MQAAPFDGHKMQDLCREQISEDRSSSSSDARKSTRTSARWTPSLGCSNTAIPPLRLPLLLSSSLSSHNVHYLKLRVCTRCSNSLLQQCNTFCLETERLFSRSRERGARLFEVSIVETAPLTSACRLQGFHTYSTLDSSSNVLSISWLVIWPRWAHFRQRSEGTWKMPHQLRIGC